MADVVDWTKQLKEELANELEWTVLKANIQIMLRSPDGTLGIHKLTYQNTKLNKENTNEPHQTP